MLARLFGSLVRGFVAEKRVRPHDETRFTFSSPAIVRLATTLESWERSETDISKQGRSMRRTASPVAGWTCEDAPCAVHRARRHADRPSGPDFAVCTDAGRIPGAEHGDTEQGTVDGSEICLCARSCVSNIASWPQLGDAFGAGCSWCVEGRRPLSACAPVGCPSPLGSAYYAPLHRSHRSHRSQTPGNAEEQSLELRSCFELSHEGALSLVTRHLHTPHGLHICKEGDALPSPVFLSLTSP